MTVAAIEDDAVARAELVFALTADAMPAVWALVLALTVAAIEEDAAASAESVWAFTFAVSVVTSDCIAREPLPRLAPVRVRVPAAQISAAIEAPEVSERVPADQTAFAVSDVSVPNDVNVLALKFHTLNGIDVASDVDAARTAPFVFAFTFPVPFATATPSEEDAAATSLCSAKEPLPRNALVKEREPFAHTLHGSELDAFSIAVFKSENCPDSYALMRLTTEDEADCTAVFVFALTDEMIVAWSGVEVETANERLSFTRSTPETPHDISTG